MDDGFLLKKNIDRSVFNRGFAVPTGKQLDFSLRLSGGTLKHGERRAIKIILNGETHEVTLQSVNFDRKKFPDHKDMWQIIYSQNSSFAQSVKKIFEHSFNFFQRGAKNLPDDVKEYFVLYATDLQDIFYLETITAERIENLPPEIDETHWENLLELPTLTDAQAALIERYSLTKIRKINMDIGNYLKRLYDFRCQICGQDPGKFYGVQVVECHHINYFSRSFNNDANNLLIVCPNHHRIIHAAEPIFDSKKKIYHYPNGNREELKLNSHL